MHGRKSTELKLFDNFSGQQLDQEHLQGRVVSLFLILLVCCRLLGGESLNKPTKSANFFTNYQFSVSILTRMHNANGSRCRNGESRAPESLSSVEEGSPTEGMNAGQLGKLRIETATDDIWRQFPDILINLTAEHHQKRSLFTTFNHTLSKWYSISPKTWWWRV